MKQKDRPFIGLSDLKTGKESNYVFYKTKTQTHGGDQSVCAPFSRQCDRYNSSHRRNGGVWLMKDIVIRNLRQLRLKKGLTQKQVAMQCNIPLSSYSVLERGLKNRISEERKQKLFELFGDAAQELLASIPTSVFPVHVRYLPTAEIEAMLQAEYGNRLRPLRGGDKA